MALDGNGDLKIRTCCARHKVLCSDGEKKIDSEVNPDCFAGVLIYPSLQFIGSFVAPI